MHLLKSTPRRTGAVLVLLSVLSMAGCSVTPPAVTFQEPTSGELAEVYFPTPDDFAPWGSRGENCPDFASNWNRRSDGTRTNILKVRANVPLMLNYTHDAGNAYCAVNFQFIPETDKSYVVMGNTAMNLDQTFMDKMLDRNLGSCNVVAAVRKGNELERIPLKRVDVDYERGWSTICLVVKEPESAKP